MDNWLDLARESRKAANILLDRQQYRSMISRAYYAVYAKATHSLLAVAVRMPAEREGPAHKKVGLLIRAHLKNLPPEKREAVSGAVRELCLMRDRADYRPSAAVQAADARAALALMRKSFEMLK